MNPSITIYVQFHKRLGYILVQLNIYVNRAFYFGYFIHFYCSHGANDVNFESENRPTRSISFVFPYFRFSFSVIDLLAANFAKMKIFSHANWIGNYARSGKTSAVCNAGFLKSAIYKAVSFFARMPRK